MCIQAALLCWATYILGTLLFSTVNVLSTFYVEECAKSDPNTTVEMDCATGVTWLEIENI